MGLENITSKKIDDALEVMLTQHKCEAPVCKFCNLVRELHQSDRLRDMIRGFAIGCAMVRNVDENGIFDLVVIAFLCGWQLNESEQLENLLKKE
jgi:hypothetical protein